MWSFRCPEAIPSRTCDDYIYANKGWEAEPGWVILLNDLGKQPLPNIPSIDFHLPQYQYGQVLRLTEIVGMEIVKAKVYIQGDL